MKLNAPFRKMNIAPWRRFSGAPCGLLALRLWRHCISFFRLLAVPQKI